MNGGVGFSRGAFRCVITKCDAWRGFSGSGVDVDDSATGDRRILKRRVGQPLHWELGAERRPPGHLQRAVNSRNRCADQAMLMVNQRVGLSAGNEAVGARAMAFFITACRVPEVVIAALRRLWPT